MSRVETFPRPTQVEIPKVKNMPLSDIVPEPERRSSPPGLITVAGHELNHALVALAHGIPIVSLSVMPKGDSLGRTVIGGWVSTETMKVIAAGGGVETHDGSAEGFGSDKYKVDVMHHFHGGHSWDSARNQAASIVSRFSNRIRERAAEIIAYLGTVAGSLIGDIMRRAQMELDQEKGIETEQLILVSNPQQEYKYKTIIDELPGNVQRIRYVVVGVVKKEEYLCGICQGINSHEEDCPNAKLKENSDESKSSPKPLTNEGIIISFPVRKPLKLVA
ncbi:MAG: hypothetical protein HYT07_02760 [Candidatus Levybacteria bacterium]|nr:hypothetical protein [Candidatus Levybacteria bacterium]